MEDIITRLKAVRISIKSEQDKNGLWSSCPEFAPGLWGKGKTISESIDDMICVWRECAAMAVQGSPDGEERLPYYAKVMVSSDEELKSCLDCQICADIRPAQGATSGGYTQTPAQDNAGRI